MLNTFIGTNYVDTSDWQSKMERIWETLDPKYMEAQLEKCPKTDRVHIQCKLWLRERKRLSWMIKHYKGFDWTGVRKDHCVHYASKEETRLEGPMIRGTLPK